MVERSLLEVEGYVRDFAVDNPHVTVAMLRFSNVLGPDITTPLAKALELPLVPAVFGFDPRFQFVHEADVVRAILFVLDGRGAGHLQRGRRRAAAVERGGRDLRQAHLPAAALRPGPARPRPLTPPRASTCRPSCSTCCATAAGVDNRRLKQAGLRLPLHLRRHGGRLRRGAAHPRRWSASTEAAYQYERDVEQFFRHSPAGRSATTERR